MKFLISFLFCICLLAGTAAAGDRPVIKQSIADTDWYPFYYYFGPERKLEGLMTDMVRELFVKELGWQLITVARPWLRAQSEVEEGETDFFVTIPTQARERYALAAGIPLFRLHLNLFTYAGHPQLERITKIRTAEDIRDLGLVLVSNRGNGWIKSHMEQQGVRTQWVAGDEEILGFLSLKRADITIDVAPTMNHRIRELGLGDKLVQTDVTFGPIDFHIMVGRNSKFSGRMDEITDALQRMRKRGVFQKLWSSYD